MKKSAIVVAGLALFGAVGASADVGPQGKAYEVSYTGQELSTHSGVAEVHERILQAAREHCPTYAQVRSVRRVQTCVAEVAADLVAKIDHPRLTGYHVGRDEVQVAAADLRDADNS